MFEVRTTSPAGLQNLSISRVFIMINLFLQLRKILLFFIFSIKTNPNSIYSPMASSLSFPAISIPSKLLLMLLVIFFFPIVRPSSIGVHYISKLLQLQDRERAPPHVQVAAARRALLRLLPSHSSSFDFQITSKVCIFHFFFLCTFLLVVSASFLFLG